MPNSKNNTNINEKKDEDITNINEKKDEDITNINEKKDEDITNIKKKRGRKPKSEKKEPKTVSSKKRGRKPKLNNNIQLEKNDNNIKTHPNVVLHLSINNDIETQTTIMPNESNVVYHKYETKNIIQDDTICNKEIYNKDIEDIIHERKNMSVNNSNFFIEYSHFNKIKKWPSQIKMCCLWDSYPFKNEPVGLPVKRKKNILYMFGNFCSPECAAAYNFSMKDENMWDRYSLLNEIYSDGVPINIANSKLMLKKYGGIYDIDEYRSINIDKKYLLTFLPIISYIPSLEEINKLNSNNFIIKTENILKDDDQKYILKRSINTNNKNTLENIMNLKYI